MGRDFLWYSLLVNCSELHGGGIWNLYWTLKQFGETTLNGPMKHLSKRWSFKIWGYAGPDPASVDNGFPSHFDERVTHN